MKRILGFFSADNRHLPIVLLCIIFALSVTLVFSGRYRMAKSDNGPSLIDPARKFYEADDLVINLQPLRDDLSALEKNPDISVYFEALNTGANIAVNKDEGFFPASLLKVPVVIAAAKKVERGEWEWNTKLELKEADKNDSFGNLWQRPVGTLFTIKELARETLVNSDNTSYFILLNNIDPQAVVDVQKHLGLTEFISADLEISSKKYAPILRALFSASYLSTENSQLILQMMSESEFNGYLAEAIPKGTVFSHKIGIDDANGTYLDAGIVYLPKRPYIIIVMVKHYSAEQAAAIMHDIGKRVYNYMLNYPK